MAFAPPRRVLSGSRTEQRKRSDPKEKGTANENKVAQKIKSVIEARNREWLAIDRNPRPDFLPADGENLQASRSVFLPRDTDQLVEDMEALLSVGANFSNKPVTVAKPDTHPSLTCDVNSHRNGDAASLEAADYQAIKNKMKTAAKPPKGLSAGSSVPAGNAQEVMRQDVADASVKSSDAAAVSRKDVRRRKMEMDEQQRHSRQAGERRPESHYCPVCQRLMSMPGYDPVCIIPCGHTLCESCSKGLQQQCPICGHNIQTTTHNVILKRIIEHFSHEHGLGQPMLDFSRDSDVIQKADGVEQRPERARRSGGQDNTAKAPRSLVLAEPLAGGREPNIYMASEADGLPENSFLLSRLLGFAPSQLIRDHLGRLVELSMTKDANESAVSLPSDADVEKWTSELSAVEMRLSVLDLQAQQTSATIVKTKARIAESMESLELLENKEQQLLDNLRYIQMQLKEVEAERVKITNHVKGDELETEKCCEQLNLITYTKAGLEAEMEKLRLLCNRA